MSIEKLAAKREIQTMLIGYARVSTEDQNLDLQLAVLKKAGCRRLFTDKISGANADRPGLVETLSHLRETDTLVVWKLDRLGRSVKGLVDLVRFGLASSALSKSLRRSKTALSSFPVVRALLPSCS
jgi:DNA invertase Pin-like site-specific DNA recombinase